MNKEIILEMVAPYLKGNTIYDSEFCNLFKVLSNDERKEVKELLSATDIYVIDDEFDLTMLCKKAEPFSKSGYLTYDKFDDLYKLLPRKKQYEIVEELFSQGIELADEENPSLDIEEALIDNLTDLSEEKNNDDYKVLYDKKIFLDDLNSQKYLFVNRNIKQSNEILCSLIQSGNMQAKQDLCVKNQKLVKKYAASYATYFKKHYGNSLEVEDLEQVGYVGLLIAAEKFNFEFDNKFSTFSVKYIKGYMVREIINCGFMIRLPQHIMEKITKINRTDNLYNLQETDLENRINHIASELQMTVKEVKECIIIRNRFLNCSSLNLPIGTDESSELEEFIEDENAILPEEETIKRLLIKDIALALSILTPREQNVIELRFGLNGQKPHTLEEVGKILDVTRERVRQIESKGIRKLRHPQRRKILEEYYEE